jgi:hypothetical protein
VKKGAFFLTDIHERGLNAGKDRLDPTKVDVTDCATMIGTVDQQLYQPVVFQDSHSGFPLASIDQDLTLQIYDLSCRRRRETRVPAGLPTTEEGACRENARRCWR